MTTLTWWEQLDLDWEIELLLLDDTGGTARCGTCGSALYTTSGTSYSN
jgi:hypothetical protein